jgi:hypothetical protein
VVINGNTRTVHPEFTETWEAVGAWLGSLVDLDGTPYPQQWVGTYSCRSARFSLLWSLHSVRGLAGDVDSPWHPQRRSVVPRALRYAHPGLTWSQRIAAVAQNLADTIWTRDQVESLLAMRYLDGSRAVRWGGTWGGLDRKTTNRDAMHIEPDGSPDTIAGGIDWSTVPDYLEDEDMTPGSDPRAIADLQALLNDMGRAPALSVDGDWGANTSAAVSWGLDEVDAEDHSAGEYLSGPALSKFSIVAHSHRHRQGKHTRGAIV